MNKIEVCVLNPPAIQDAEVMMVAAARMTQRGHKVKNLADFLTLYNRPYSDGTVLSLTQLPHPTIQKFGIVNIVVVGASRRFLAQITRHQNEVKFMSASLQYSDYSSGADFAVPWEIIDQGEEAVHAFLADCEATMTNYRVAIEQGMSNDTAGYLAPQALRNVLIISATPYQWKHMISQRICNRNTAETKYVMELIHAELLGINPIMFGGIGPSCVMTGKCLEKEMRCSEGYYQTDRHVPAS